MNAQLSTSVVALIRIGQEELEVLQDIQSRCFLPNKKARAAFEASISSSVGQNSFKDIFEDDFETAFNVAMKTLRDRGEAILRGELKNENLALGTVLKLRR